MFDSNKILSAQLPQFSPSNNLSEGSLQPLIQDNRVVGELWKQLHQHLLPFSPNFKELRLYHTPTTESTLSCMSPLERSVFYHLFVNMKVWNTVILNYKRSDWSATSYNRAVKILMQLSVLSPSVCPTRLQICKANDLSINLTGKTRVTWLSHNFGWLGKVRYMPDAPDYGIWKNRSALWQKVLWQHPIQTIDNWLLETSDSKKLGQKYEKWYRELVAQRE